MGEALAEAVDVEPTDAFLAFPDAAEEAHFAVVGEQLDHLVIHALVDQVAVEELQLAHVELVLAALQAPVHRLEPGFELRELVFGHSDSPKFSMRCKRFGRQRRVLSTADHMPSFSSRFTSSR